MLFGGHSLDSLKSSFINTPISQQPVWSRCLESVESPHLAYKAIPSHPAASSSPATPAKPAGTSAANRGPSPRQDAASPAQPLLPGQAPPVLTRTSAALSAHGSMQLSWFRLFKCLATKAPKERSHNPAPVCYSITKSTHHHCRQRFDVVFVFDVQCPRHALEGRLVVTLHTVPNPPEGL